VKAITTRYLSPTMHRAGRIVATDLDGNRAIVPAEGGFPYDNAHRAAAVALCQRMGWPGAETLVGGAIPHAMVWVFTDPPAAPAGGMTCRHCRAVLRVDDHGTLIDPTGGDVCGVASANVPASEDSNRPHELPPAAGGAPRACPSCAASLEEIGSVGVTVHEYGEAQADRWDCAGGHSLLVVRSDVFETDEAAQ
jgi:hypothetical protein